MQRFEQTCEAVAATTRKLEKVGLVAEYLKSLAADDAALAAVFFSGRPFPVWEETTLQVGGALLWRMVGELAGRDEVEFREAYRKFGDLGALAGAVLPEKAERDANADLSLRRVEESFRKIAAVRGPAAKSAVVRELLVRATAREAKYLVKIMTGDLRIGLKESLVEEAIARAYGATIGEVQRANMLFGDIGKTVRFASAGKLDEARMRLFHPLGFMLASPVESAEEGLSYFERASVEDKYDGIRAQAHASQGEVRFFSRTRDEITESFPELPEALAGLPEDAILDGEIVAWSYDVEEDEHGRALPFTALQARLGRKKVSAELMRRVPVAYLAFDVLYAGGELLLEKPLEERMQRLDALLDPKKRAHHRVTETQRRKGQQGRLQFEDRPLTGSEPERSTTRVIRAPHARAEKPEDLEVLFAAAQARGNEGLMVKDLTSPYTPGRRGKSWLKMKRALATLDVVVTAVEYGHGKRIGVLSDYTFAVSDGERLVNVGKAYSGLTDAEIAEMTQWFLAHTLVDEGFRRQVEPRVVLEVAFNNVMESDRHESGYALRFPRIVRIRTDKPVEEIDTVDRVREIYEGQARGSTSKA
jgi:DNA ligase-1